MKFVLVDAVIGPSYEQVQVAVIIILDCNGGWS
jgi:hypothetical protein